MSAITPSDFFSLLGITFVTLGVALALGYFMNGLTGAITLFVPAVMAVVVCLTGALLGWTGLIAAVILATIGIAVSGGLAFGRRGALCFGLLWTGWWIFCLWGYQAAGPVGLILLTLPALALFWGGAYWLSQELLPLGDNPSVDERRQAFRALLTCTLGTNYPYYTVENRTKTQRAPGDLKQSFFAGPGLIITGCDHVVVTADAITLKGVRDPGLAFTGKDEAIAEIMDLRYQQRAFEVEALTKDGIRIKVFTAASFRIYAGGDQPELGKPFPFRKSSIFNVIMRGQPVEHSQERRDDKVFENKQKHSWDEMVSIVATQAVRRIIGEYLFDDLCAPDDPSKNPRQEIAARLLQQLRDELEPIGIQVIGGGVGNLMPADSKLLQQRIGNWQSEWTRRITEEMGKSDAEYIRIVEKAWTEAHAEMIRTVSEGVRQAQTVDKNISTEVIALRFVEALEKMIQTPSVQQALPTSSAETVGALRRAIERQAR